MRLLLLAIAACLFVGAALAEDAAPAAPSAGPARLLFPRSSVDFTVNAPLRGRFEPVQAPVKRPGGARLKTSLNAYSFNKSLNDQIKGRGKGISLLELLDFCAEQNFDAIDPTGYFFPGYPKPPSAEYLNDFKRRAFLLGLDISGTGVRNNFASPDKDNRAADVRHVKEWVEVAARMVRRRCASLPALSRPAIHGMRLPSGWLQTSSSVSSMAKSTASSSASRTTATCS